MRKEDLFIVVVVMLWLWVCYEVKNRYGRRSRAGLDRLMGLQRRDLNR